MLTNISIRGFWDAKAKALIDHRLWRSVVKQIKHKTSDMLSLSWREFKSLEEQILHVADQLWPLNKPTSVNLLYIVVIQTNSRAGAMFQRSA